MNNKFIKGWHNIDKLYVEYTCKQVTCIQKSRTESLKGIEYIGYRRKCKAVFLKFVQIGRYFEFLTALSYVE